MIEVKNFGIPGATSQVILERALLQALEFHPTLAVVLAGTNDCANPDCLRTAEEYRMSMRAIFDRLNAERVRILAVTIPPVIESEFYDAFGAGRYLGVGPSARIRLANAVLLEEAARAGAAVADLHAEFLKQELKTKYSSLRCHLNYNFENDGCHPSHDGSLRMAELLERSIQAMHADVSKIACIGDSITAGAYLEDEGKYPSRLAHLLHPNPAFAKKVSSNVENMVIYQMFLRAFTDEGTISAAEKHLDEIAASGADFVYLVPFVEADADADEKFWSARQRASGCGNARSPYRLADYSAVDPEYGTDADFLHFTEECHARGLKVMVDLVYFHAGPTFAERHGAFVRKNPDGTVKFGPWHFPELDFTNPELREHLFTNMEMFVRDFHVDGFRCDVGDEIPLDFWTEARRRCEKIHPVVMLCEGESRTEDSLEAFDVNYSFSYSSILNDILRGERVAADLVLYERLRRAVWPRGARFLRSFDNHDIANDQYSERTESFCGTGAVESALVLCFLLDGVPFLYNGVEWKDSNRHSIFARKGEFTIRRTGSVPPRAEFLRTLAAIRRSDRVFSCGETVFTGEGIDKGAIVFTRTLGTHRVFCAVNLTPCELALAPHPGGKILLERGVKRTTGCLTLAGRGFFVLAEDSESTEK